MWQRASVCKAVDLCKNLNLNALVFHQNELLDDLVIPAESFGDALIWDRWPLRQSRALRRQQYLRQILEDCRKHSIDFYIEIKEPWFPSDIFDIVPGLRSENGSICPSHPFWNEYISAKTRALLQVLPEIAGIIISPATFETKISISSNACGCELCKNTSPRAWYAALIGAMFEQLNNAGKKLIVRDFTYTVEEQNRVILACKDVSDSIILSLKNVPHDYWPTFPDNPRIGNTNGLRQWIEYDVWGQYMGCGFFPVSLIRDLRKRICHCLENSAEGIIFRTDWEHLQEASVMNSLNLLNLFAGAMLSENPDTPAGDIYRAYCNYGINSPLHEESERIAPEIPANPNAPEILEAYMETAYDAMIYTLYARRHVLHYSSRFHHSFNFVDYVLLEHHTLEYWLPGSLEQIAPTEENLAEIYAEKASAQELYRKLAAMHMPEAIEVSPKLSEELSLMTELFGWYIDAFCLACHCYFDMRRLLERPSEETLKTAEESVRRMKQYACEFSRKLSEIRLPAYAYWVLSPETLVHFADDHADMLQSFSEKAYHFGQYDRSRIFETQVI